jgi:hypothetical protein
MTTIKSDLTAGLEEDLVAIYNQVYVVNDWDRMHVWDGYRTSMVIAGIDPPEGGGVWNISPSVALGTGSVEVGTHLMRYRFMDSKTQYVSNPTPPVEITIGTAGKAIRGLVVNASSDEKVDTIVVEMTRAGGDVFFQATAMPNANSDISVAYNDPHLAAFPTFYEDFGHEPPPYFNIVEAFRGRLWGLGHVVWDQGQAGLTNNLGTTQVQGGGDEGWTSAIVGRVLRFSGEADRYFITSADPTIFQLWTDRSVAASHAGTGYSIVSDAPDVLFFSKPVFPQSWPVENQIKVLDGQPEKARAIKGFRQDLVIYGERRMEVLTFVNDPFADGRLEPVQGERGASNHKVVVDVAGFMYALDYKGIHRFVGGPSQEPEHISEFLDPYFDPGDQSRGYVDFTQRDQFHAVHFPQLHQVLWFVVLNGLPGDATEYTQPQHAFVFDYLNMTWGVLRFDIPITCSTNVRGTNGQNYTVFGDTNGYFWVYGVNTLDGPPSSAENVLTVNSVQGTQVWTDETLYTDNLGLQGVPVYWPSSDVVGVVDTNSADNFVLLSTMNALSTGAVLHLGAIRSKLKSKAFAWWTERMKMQGRFLHLYYQPKDSGEARLRFYLERSTLAPDHEVALSTDGVVASVGNNYFDLSLSEKAGRWKIPMPHTYFHVIEWELEVLEPGTELLLLRYEMDGYAEEEREQD